MSAAAAPSSRSRSAVLSSAADVLLALSNGRRLAILHAVVELNAQVGPVGLAQLGERVGLDARQLAKEVVRLTEAGLLRRDQGALTAQLGPLGELGEAVAEFTALGRTVPPDSPLRRFLTHGRVTDLPKRPEDLAALAAALADLLPADRTLTEAEVNELLGQAGDDVARLRRLLVDLGLVQRSGSAQYRRSAAVAS
ncbi:DUF2087 domain-containing protein [Streptomyces tateyamensis]|uniref:DUF2087 domain-containing protein n=1 Tax=Streptomyces tateyamensis TaxID=565073 RepID=UPI0011B41C03|nr:DUF2087 domain-containing protein [Streptomyces tateyamensis]